MNNYPKSKPTRLKEYDYTRPGYYYVTICTHHRKHILGNIIDNRMQLNSADEMVDRILRTLPEYYPDITIDNYVVMPNHVHAIIIIKEPVDAAPCGRPLINTCLKPDTSSNPNNLSDSGPAQRQVPTAQVSLSDIIYRFRSLTTKHYIDGVKNNNWQPFRRRLTASQLEGSFSEF